MHKISIDMEALDRHLARGYLDNLGKGAKAMENKSMEEIRQKIKVGKQYQIIRGSYGEIFPNTNKYKIIYKDKVKFLGKMECGVRECFLFQDILCRHIKVIDKNGDRIKEDTKQIQPIAIHLTGSRRYKLWTPEEEELILNSDKPDKELAKQLKRSVKTIKSRRYKLRQERS